jgi:AraC-like DNA-binding protein
MDWVQKIIEENLRETPTIPEIAKMVGINEQKLKSLFKKTFTKTLNAYQTETRLNVAKNLLINSDMNIGQIAEEIGYKNKGYFSKRFKEHFGILPVEYVKHHK